MPRLFPAGRIAVCGLTLLLSCASGASAGEFFGHLCGGHGKHHGRASGYTAGAPIYMPMSAPQAAMPPLALSLANQVEHNPLATAHECELLQLRQERCRAALQAEMEYTKKVLERMGRPGVDSGRDAGVSAEIQQKLNSITASLAQIEGRLTAVEKLLLIHDNYLRDKIPPAVDNGKKADK
jgi:hypothetical protein